MNAFGTTPPAPKRLRLPAGGDVLSVCPLKNRVGTHLFVAGGGAIAYYPHFMQDDCAHAENPDPVIIESGNADIASVTAMSSFVNDGKIYVYALSSSGRIYYAFAGYDERQDAAGEFSQLLLLRENCLYFQASEGRMFICEKNKLLFGERDQESGAYNGLLYFLDDVFNFLYKAGKKAASFLAKIVNDTVEFVIHIGKQVFKFVLDTAWKVLEAVAKVLSHIGIPLDKLLDFLKYTFDIGAIVQERPVRSEQRNRYVR